VNTIKNKHTEVRAGIECRTITLDLIDAACATLLDGVRLGLAGVEVGDGPHEHATDGPT
jgi:hypothetical protein